MFGIQSFAIWSAYLLCILSTLACLVYGIINWNKGGDDKEEQEERKKQWKEEQSKIQDNL